MIGVSCQVSGWILELLEHEEISPEQWIRNLPVQLAQLRDPDKRIDWDVFATLCERLEQLCGGPEPLARAAHDLAERTLLRSGVNEAARFTHSRQLYWLAQRWLAPALFYGVEVELRDLDDAGIELSVRLPAEERPCPPLFVLIEAALAAAPQVLGEEPAKVAVHVEEDGHRARFTIPGSELREHDSETMRAQLEDSEQRYRAITQTSRDMILEIDSAGSLAAITPNIREILGYSDEELVGAKRSDLIHPEDREALTERLGKLLRTGDSERLRFRVQHRDGHWRRIETAASAYRASDGSARGVLVSRDVTERLLSEQAMDENEQSYQIVADKAYDLIAETNGNGRFIYLSPGYRETLGYAPEDLLGSHAHDLMHPEDRGPALRAARASLEGEAHGSPPFRVRHRDGSWRWVESRFGRYQRAGEKIVVILSRDVSAIRGAEEELQSCREQLFHAQRTESIGRLAGGIAHDFNNLLTAIGGYGALLREELGPDHPLQPDVDEIIRSAVQAGDLTRQLLNFGRRQEPRPKITDLNALVAAVDRLLRRVMGEDVDLATSLDGDLGKAKIDPGQIEQLIVNLAMNARDAMPRGGRLVITTANAEIQTEGDVEGVPPGRWVTLEVRDSGVGMDPKTLSRIFEPFFSTKEARRGTGLGLSTVAAIAKQSGGHVTVESAPGRGSTFCVYLPRVDEPEARREAPAALTDLRGSETVLLVEDAKAVRSLLRRDLERHGYTVIDAPSANEAISRLKRHDGGLDLLVTDVVLPGTDGPTLADQLRDEHPDLRVIYITAGSDENLAERGVSNRDDVVLRKPLFAPALLNTLREVLAAAPREPAEPPPEE